MSDLSSNNQPSTTPIRHVTPRIQLTEERKRLYLETLRKTGSHKAASCAASGHLVKAGSPNSRLGVGTFTECMKRDPEFAEQVREALAEAIANVEHVVYDRIHLPNRRPIYDRNGVLLGYDESWKDANTLALRFLEKHDATWVQRKQIDGTQTVIHTDAEMGSGAAYVVKPADLMLLPPESRLALLDLLQQIEDARDGTPALPGPVEGGTDGPE